MRVKICGINSELALDTVAEAGADCLGFVFFPPSPRAVTAAQAARLAARLGGQGPRKVGLFVRPSLEQIAEVLDHVALDALQLNEPGDLAPFRRFGLPLWLAHGVCSAADLPASAMGADELLLDAKAPPGATRPGGNAIRFDWQILKGWQPPAPWWLAGGLNPDHVADAIRISGARAVEVSSGVESAPGVKDPARIRRFIAAARGAD